MSGTKSLLLTLLLASCLSCCTPEQKHSSSCHYMKRHNPWSHPLSVTAARAGRDKSYDLGLEWNADCFLDCFQFRNVTFIVTFQGILWDHRGSCGVERARPIFPKSDKPHICGKSDISEHSSHFGHFTRIGHSAHPAPTLRAPNDCSIISRIVASRKENLRFGHSGHRPLCGVLSDSTGRGVAYYYPLLRDDSEAIQGCLRANQQMTARPGYGYKSDNWNIPIFFPVFCPRMSDFGYFPILTLVVRFHCKASKQ